MTGVQFNLTGSPANILALHFRWVATVGEHLQLFPITQTFPDTIDGVIVRIPFDYNANVVWSAGNFEVAATSLISSFSMITLNNYHRVGGRIAEWDASLGDYGALYSTSIVLVDVNSLYGLHCPFTNDGGTDKVIMTTWGTIGSVVTSFLVFHKVQQPGTNALVTTGFGDVRDDSRIPFIGDYSDNIASSSYNVNGVDPTATRVYGI
jgi:hypothetical protein